MPKFQEMENTPLEHASAKKQAGAELCQAHGKLKLVWL